MNYGFDMDHPRFFDRRQFSALEAIGAQRRMNESTVKMLKKVARRVGIVASLYNFMTKETLVSSIMGRIRDNGGLSASMIHQIYEDHRVLLGDNRWCDNGDELWDSEGREQEREEFLRKDKPEEGDSEMEEATTTTPSAGGLEGALTVLIEAAMGDKVETVLTERGLTKDGVEAVIGKYIKSIEVPRFIRKDGDSPPQLTHPSFMAMAETISLGLTPYLFGPAGSGKTHGAQQYGAMVGRPVTIIPCNENMEVTDLTGYRDMRGEFVETAFYQAFRNGHIIVMDEADKAPGPVLVALNSPVQQRVMMFPNGTAKAHDDVAFVFTGNTRMSGASATYSTGQRQDTSFTNRLEFIVWDYDNKLEKSLVMATAKAYEVDTSAATEWMKTVRSVRKQIKKLSLSYIAGPRQSISGVKLLSLGLSPDDIADRTMYGWMRDEDARRIKEAI